jgi:phosphoglycolate phosphatase
VEADYRLFVAFYAANIAHGSTPFPGLVRLLERLKDEGFGLGVCTNKLEGLSVQLLDALDLAKYFGSVVGPDTLGIAKPDPKPFFEAVRRLDLDSPRALMVGDSETDILTARNAGVPVIAVPFGYTPRPVVEFGPDRMIDHFDEAYEAIQELFAEA